MYNIGDNVICKYNKIQNITLNITINRTYKIIDIDNDGIQIKDDSFNIIWFDYKKEGRYRIIENHFYSKTEIRKIKLKSL